MRTAYIIAGILAGCLGASNAQDHLIPEPGAIAAHDEYYSKLREAFAAAQKEEVVCQVIAILSFLPEECTGIRKNATGYEVFSLRPSSAIWDTETLRMYEAGKIGTSKDGREVPLEENEGYQKLKKRTPADFREIPIKLKATPIDEATACRVTMIWQQMLLATRHPKEPRQGVDGGSFHFSMFVLGRGMVSGQVWSPAAKTKTEALVGLGSSLGEFCAGRMDLAALKKAVDLAEKAVGHSSE